MSAAPLPGKKSNPRSDPVSGRALSGSSQTSLPCTGQPDRGAGNLTSLLALCVNFTRKSPTLLSRAVRKSNRPCPHRMPSSGRNRMQEHGQGNLALGFRDSCHGLLYFSGIRRNKGPQRSPGRSVPLNPLFGHGPSRRSTPQGHETRLADTRHHLLRGFNHACPIPGGARPTSRMLLEFGRIFPLRNPACCPI